MKKYDLIIKEVDEKTEETKVIHSGRYTSVSALLQCEEENRMGEVMIGQSILDLGHKIVNSKKFIIAAELAVLFKMATENGGIAESDLIKSILKGVDEE